MKVEGVNLLFVLPVRVKVPLLLFIFILEMYFIFSTVVDNILVESRLVSELIRARNSAEKSGIFIIIGVKLV